MFNTNKMVLLVATQIHADLNQRDVQFDEDRAEWYRAGEGRPRRDLVVDDHGDIIHPVGKVDLGGGYGRWDNFGGQGHSYPYACVHGSSAWTDYDNICGPCEDGTSNMEVALWQARTMVARWEHRMDAYMAAVRAGVPLAPDAAEWANFELADLLTKIATRRKHRKSHPLP